MLPIPATPAPTSPASFDSPSIMPLAQRILLVENSRTFTTMLREAIEQRLELPVSVASSLAEAGERLTVERDGSGWRSRILSRCGTRRWRS